MTRWLALLLVFAPLARAAGPVDSEFGSEVKWDILVAAKHARSEVPDACLCRAEAFLDPDGDRFVGHFWSETKSAYYQMFVNAHSQTPSDLEKGDSGVAPICIREVPIGADRAIATAMKHGFKTGSDARAVLELLKIEKESMGDELNIYVNVRAARGRLVWVIMPGQYRDFRNVWVIEAVTGRFIAHGDYTSLPLGKD